MEVIHTTEKALESQNNNLILAKRGIFNELSRRNTKVAIIGLGQDGIIEVAKFSEHFNAIGFDENKDRVNLLQGQINPFNLSDGVQDNIFSSNIEDIKKARLYVITAKPALNEYYKPNLRSLTTAVRTVAKVLKKRDHVIFKFTSFPGCIEEICQPILEKESKLKLNRDFTIGFAPEKFEYQPDENGSSKKLVSSSNPNILAEYLEIFKKVEGDFVHPVPNIRLTEILNIISHRIPTKSIRELKYA